MGFLRMELPKIESDANLLSDVVTGSSEFATFQQIDDDLASFKREL